MPDSVVYCPAPPHNYTYVVAARCSILNSMNMILDNTYTQLPDHFYTRLAPTPVTEPKKVRINNALADFLGLDTDWLTSPEGIEVLAGNRVPAAADPIATVYAGHQFGSYNPQLGDGRALLLGEVTTANGQRYDLQLKGSGPTPYSRGGDGRSPLAPVLREYILCEAMHQLGVPSTRALAAVTTGELVTREDYLPGAVLTRVASSHIRVGTFQFFAARGDNAALQQLTDYVIARHFPKARDSDNPPLAMLQSVLHKQAELIAQWQLLGFIHGVMNTDNVLICGETIDYGPCAFMDNFDPAQVYSSIDHHGRYAYRNQPGIAHWNLAQLAQALLPLLHEREDRAIALAQQAIDGFTSLFQHAYRQGMGKKLGLTSAEAIDDTLMSDFLELLAAHRLDFTLSFRHLADLAHATQHKTEIVADLIEFPEAMSLWLGRWRKRLQADSQQPSARQAMMYRANPAFIPRNHLVDSALTKATVEGDFSEFHRLVDVLDKPWEYRVHLAEYAAPPRPDQLVAQTFCGT